LIVIVLGPRLLFSQERLVRGRFTVVSYPTELTLARALLDAAVVTDTFPGLPRPIHQVVIELAPDHRRFREWIGPSAPEWGAAIAFPDSWRIVMQGRSAGADAGNPVLVLRHELAHLALHEYLGDLAPHWFDEGYAAFSARELDRNEVLAANLALAMRGMPSFEELDQQFGAGSTAAQAAYALAFRAVSDIASLDPKRGLTLLFQYWKTSGSLDRAMRLAYGVTLAGFEKRWQERTRQHYGALAVFGDLTVAGLLVLVIVTPLYLARRRRDRRRFAALVAADVAAEHAARESVLDELLGDPPAAGGSRNQGLPESEGTGQTGGDKREPLANDGDSAQVER
jgi:Peptidase MA superfamily